MFGVGGRPAERIDASASSTIVCCFLRKWFQLLQSTVIGHKEETQYSTALLSSGVSFHFLCQPVCSKDQRGKKSIPWRRWRFLWRLIFASSVWKQFQIHISNLKENITVSDSAFFARTETKHSGRKVRNLQMSKVTGDKWSRSALFFFLLNQTPGSWCVWVQHHGVRIIRPVLDFR